MRVICLIALALGAVTANLAAHPLKMAYTSVKYNAAKQVFEISHRVFQDDFEATLKEKYDYTGGDVYVNQKKAETQQAVNRFFEKNFSIIFDKKTPKLRYIKTEQKQQMGIIVWYETDKIPVTDLKSVSIYNYIMMESFKEQVNMFSLNISTEVKRTLKFELDKTRATITI